DGIRDCHVTGVQTCALPILVAGGNDQLNFDIRICLFKRFDQSPLDRKLQLIAPRRVGDRRLRADARGQNEAQHDAQHDNFHGPHGVTVPPLEESDLNLRDDARTTSLLLTSITRETTSSLASRLSASTASRPIATGSCRTVVSGGLRCRAIARSSYPATATSAGTLSPSSARALIAPAAIRSLAAKTASKGASRHAASTASYAFCRLKSP